MLNSRYLYICLLVMALIGSHAMLAWAVPSSFQNKVTQQQPASPNYDPFAGPEQQMKYLFFVACRMKEPGECMDIELRRPSSEPLSVCNRMAPKIMRQWREKAHLDWFIRSWSCSGRDRNAHIVQSHDTMAS